MMWVLLSSRMAWTASKRKPSTWYSSSQYRALWTKKSRTGRSPGPSKLMPAPQGVWWRSVKNDSRIGVEVVPGRPEMVVDDVDEHHQAERMGPVDEALEVVRRAVGRVGREGQDAVIAPVAAARELGERHELDRRDAGVAESSSFAIRPA